MKCITLSSGKQVCFDSTAKFQPGGKTLVVPNSSVKLPPLSKEQQLAQNARIQGDIPIAPAIANQQFRMREEEAVKKKLAKQPTIKLSEAQKKDIADYKRRHGLLIEDVLADQMMRNKQSLSNPDDQSYLDDLQNVLGDAGTDIENNDFGILNAIFNIPTGLISGRYETPSQAIGRFAMRNDLNQLQNAMIDDQGNPTGLGMATDMFGPGLFLKGLNSIPKMNPWKINPFAEKLKDVNKSYRVTGLDALEDFQNTGVLRSRRILPENPTFADIVAARSTGFPSFQKGYADFGFLPKEGGVVFETSLPTFKRGEINPVTGNVIKGSHYAHRVINPETGQVMTEIPAKDIRVFGDKPHWLKGYQEINGPSKGVISNRILSNFDPRNLKSKPALDWIKQWHSHPDFINRYSNNKNLFIGGAERFQKDVLGKLDRYQPKNYIELLKDKGFEDFIEYKLRSQGVSYGTPDNIYVNRTSFFPFNKIGKESVTGHELSHLTDMNGLAFTPEDKEDLLKPFGYSRSQYYQKFPTDKHRKRGEGYYLDPTEIRARMTQGRMKFGLMPNDKFTSQMFDEMLQSNNWEGMGNYIKDKKGFIDLMNKFWAVPAGAVGVGAAAKSVGAEQPIQRKGGLIKAQEGLEVNEPTVGPITLNPVDINTTKPFPKGPMTEEEYKKWEASRNRSIADQRIAQMEKQFGPMTNEQKEKFRQQTQLQSGSITPLYPERLALLRGATLLPGAMAALELPAVVGGTTIPLATGNNILGLAGGIIGANMLDSDLNTGYYSSDAPMMDKVGRSLETGLGFLGSPGMIQMIGKGLNVAKTPFINLRNNLLGDPEITKLYKKNNNTSKELVWKKIGDAENTSPIFPDYYNLGSFNYSKPLSDSEYELWANSVFKPFTDNLSLDELKNAHNQSLNYFKDITAGGKEHGLYIKKQMVDRMPNFTSLKFGDVGSNKILSPLIDKFLIKQGYDITKMTPQERLLMEGYAHGYDRLLNETLRKNYYTVAPEFYQEMSDILKEGILKNKFKEPTVVRRGILTDYEVKLLDPITHKPTGQVKRKSELTKGDVFRDEGFLSTSIDPNHSWGNPNLSELIEIPGGGIQSVAVPGAAARTKFRTEQEAILPTGLIREVTQDPSSWANPMTKFKTKILNPYTLLLLGVGTGAGTIKKKQKGGKNINNTGYLDNSDTKHNPYNVIPSNNITMDGVSIPLLLMPDGDKARVVMPHSGEYNFPNSQYVTEIPLAQKGMKVYPQPTTQDSVILYNNQLLKDAFYKNNPNYKRAVNRTSNADLPNIIYKMDPNHLKRLINVASSGRMSKEYATKFNKQPNEYKSELEKRFKKLSNNVYSVGDILAGDLDFWFNPDAPPSYFSPTIKPKEWISYGSQKYDDYTNIPMYDAFEIKPSVLRTPEENVEWEKRYGTPQSKPVVKNKPTQTKKSVTKQELVQPRETLESLQSREVSRLTPNFEDRQPMSINVPSTPQSSEESNRKYSIRIPTVDIIKRAVSPKGRCIGKGCPSVNPKPNYKRSIEFGSREVPIIDDYNLNKGLIKMGMEPRFQPGGQAVKKGPGPFLIPESRAQFKSIPVDNLADPRLRAYQDSVIQNNKSIEALQNFNKAYNTKQPYVATPENLTDDYKNSGVKQQAKYTNPKNTKNYLQPSKKIDDLNEEQRANLLEAFNTQQEGTPINLPTALYYGDLFNNSTYRNEDIWFDYHTNPVQPYHLAPIEQMPMKEVPRISVNDERPLPNMNIPIPPPLASGTPYKVKTEGLTVPVPTVNIVKETVPPRVNAKRRQNKVNVGSNTKTKVKFDIDQREILSREDLDSLRGSVGLDPKGYQSGGKIIKLSTGKIIKIK